MPAEQTDDVNAKVDFYLLLLRNQWGNGREQSVCKPLSVNLVTLVCQKASVLVVSWIDDVTDACELF